MYLLDCKTLLLLLRWDTGKVRDRFDGMGRFKGGLRCKEWVNSIQWHAKVWEPLVESVKM